jgi:hypothetical protein
MKNRALVAALAAGLVCIASQAFAFERLDRLILNTLGGGYGCGCDNACGKEMACGCDRGCHRDRCCRDRCHRGCGLFGHHGCGCGCDTAAPTCEAKGAVQAPSCEAKASCGCDRGCRDRCHRGCFSFCHRDRCGGCGGCGWFGGHHGCGCEAKCGCGY